MSWRAERWTGPAGLTVALATCGGSGFGYVSNSELGAYFKNPEGWLVFDVVRRRPRSSRSGR